MKKEKKKIREPYDIVTDIKKVFEENNNSIPEKEIENMKSLFSEADIINKKNTYQAKIAGIVFLIVFLFIGIMFYIGLTDYDEISRDNIQKASIIKMMELEDKLLMSFIRQGNLKDTIPNGQKLTFDYMLKTMDSIQIRLIKKDAEIDKLKYKLVLIKSIYHISIDDNYKIQSPQLDSALILLPTFRDRMKFDKKNNSWTIRVN